MEGKGRRYQQGGLKRGKGINFETGRILLSSARDRVDCYLAPEPGSAAAAGGDGGKRMAALLDESVNVDVCMQASGEDAVSPVMAGRCELVFGWGGGVNLYLGPSPGICSPYTTQRVPPGMYRHRYRNTLWPLFPLLTALLSPVPSFPSPSAGLPVWLQLPAGPRQPEPRH